MKPATAAERRRDQIVVALLGFIPDAAVAYVAMKLTDGEWSTFWWVWIAIQVLYLFNWTKRAVWSSLLWRLGLRRRAAAEALAALRASGLPRPNEDDRDVDHYLARLIDDDEQPVAVRVKAAEWRAVLEEVAQRGLQQALQAGQAWEDAFAAYSRG
jgi:hypothetical protein